MHIAYTDYADSDFSVSFLCSYKIRARAKFVWAAQKLLCWHFVGPRLNEMLKTLYNKENLHWARLVHTYNFKVTGKVIKPDAQNALKMTPKYLF